MRGKRWPSSTKIDNYSLMQRLLDWTVRPLFALLVCAVATAALAHRLNVSLQPEASGLRGQAFYSDGTPAARETVTLHGTDVRPLASTTTDAEGHFQFPLSAAGSYRVVVSADEGHRAESSIAWTPLPTATPATVDAAALAAAVRTEIAPLRADLARLEARTRLADLVGGIGILLGVFGAWAWWRSRAHR